MRITTITPPAFEPVTVDEAKLQCRISHDVEDSLIAHWIKAGREMAQAFQRRAYVEQTLELSFDNFPRLPIELPSPPLVSVSSVKYYDTDNTEYSMSMSSFIVDTASQPGRIVWAYNELWPAVTLRPADAVKIRYVAGFSESENVPYVVKAAIMLFVSHMNENRTGEAGPVPPAFYNLLRPTRVFV